MIKHSHVTARVTRQLKASPERVFDAWVKPEFVTQWLFTSAASDPAGRHVEVNGHVGGAWTIRDRRNGQDYEGDGEYLEIDRPHKLVFTFRMKQFSDTVDRVTVEIEPLGQGSLLTLTQEITVPHDDTMTTEQVQEMLTQFRAGTEHGWNEMLDLLEKRLG